MSEQTTRETLVLTAAKLFRQKGYHGVALAEILAACDLPKGSLYHHFPGGKRELARAATLWTGAMVEKLVGRSFDEARTFEEGAAALCFAVSTLIKPKEPIQACPVASILQASTQEPELRAAALEVLRNWTRSLTSHASRLGHPAPDRAAELLLMQLEGAWLFAVAEQSARPFERIAAVYRPMASGQVDGERSSAKRR